MKFVMASFSSESVGTAFVNCAFHSSPQIIIGGAGSGNHGGHMSFEIILTLNTSYSSVIETGAVCAVAL
jgi:hypothetical protein